MKLIVKLGMIVKALGVERVWSEFVLFLVERDDEDDECLLVIVGELVMLIDVVGGEEYVYVILVLLEMLIMVEEMVVRVKAVETACAVGRAMTSGGIGKYFVFLIERLV